MKRVSSIGFLAALMALNALPASAGLFDIFKSEPAIDCAPRDAGCIFESALKLDMYGFENREVKQNYSSYAKRAALLMLTQPNIDEEAYRARWTEAGADEKFFAEFDRWKRDASPPKAVPLSQIADYIQNKETPDGERLSDYLKRQIPIAFETQGQEARDFWLDNLRPIWKNGWSSVLPALRWMAYDDIDTLEAYADQFRLPEGGPDNPYELLGIDAASICASGKIEQGLRVLAILEKKTTYWDEDRDRRAMDKSSFAPAILHCRGEKEAMAFVDEILTQMDLDLAAATKKFQNEKERSFVLGVIRSEVAERMIQPLVLRLHSEGREGEARALYARLPPMGFSMTIGEVADGDLTAAQFPEQSYKELIEFQSGTDMYSGDPDVSLRYFVDEWETDFEICCSDEQELGYATDYIKAAWPRMLAQKGADKNLAYHQKLLAKDPDKINVLHGFQLELATLERRTYGCNLTDETLKSVLSEMPDYKYAEQRVSVATKYLNFLKQDAPAEKPTDPYICKVK